MASTINTNINSLTAQRNLSNTQMAQQTALQRLSSGLRINSAKDDAAGLAISDRMTTQIRGLNQAARNANDAISLAQTAEGALGQLTNNLQRMRELAVQSANATNTGSDRVALQQEFSLLSQENDRIAGATSFNGVKLLDGTFSAQAFQVGANAGDTITVASIGNARGLTGGYSITVAAGTAWNGTVTLNATGYAATAVSASVAGPEAGQTATSAYALAVAANKVSAQTGVSAIANAASVTGTASTNAGSAAGVLQINGVSIGAVAVSASAETAGQLNAQAINAVSSQTGVTAVADSAGKLTLTAADGRDITIAGTGTTFGLTAATTTGSVTYTTNAGNTITTSAAAGGLGNGAITLSGTTADISTAASASAALATLDQSLAKVSANRAALGAIQSRFAATVENLQTTSENLSASRSRILDADFAQETANLSRAQVLAQAGTAMVAQANSQPQGVLALLRNL